ARECEEQRKKSQFSKAVDAARKALAIEPNLPAAHICIATVYEAQHMPLDSLLAAYQRAAKGDSLNATAWENIAHVYQQKGDTPKLADTTLLKAALGAAQQISDTQQLLFFSRAAVRHFPKSAAFWKALGSAYDLKAQKDSSVWAYKQSLKIDPTDVKASLLVARGIVEGSTWDTAQANKLKSDTAALHALRNVFADRIDSAKAYLAPASSSPDSTDRL